ncbi:MAG: aminotransferase class I/II-fold pyridoxal phosphate-dependent enzyme [Planctomycetes bacterium]|nr:aminotransferase class I/II-fold pyridoxal phosphate-dependent enzyme [Planctomycetota bacterium]
MSTADPAQARAAAPAGRRETFLPFSRPTIEDDEIAQVVDSLRSGWITTGPKVTRFEEMFTERLGGHAVAVASATAGLHVTIAALDPKPGDEFIVPAMTWASTANVVELCGARTVFADVHPDTLQIDADDVARRITKRTRAILPVHYAGQPADLDALRALADAHGLTIIEDAAHALGTAYKGVEIGRDSEVAVYSFHPIKNVTTGEGGMVVCRDEAFADRLRRLRFHGVSKDAWKRYRKGGGPRYDVLEPAWKYNMMDLQAALGLEQMKKLERFNARRTELGERYHRLFADVDGIAPLGHVPYEALHAWHLYVVRLDLDACTLDRDAFMGALTEENIGTGLHFPALHMATYYREKYGHDPDTLPNAYRAGETIFSLPLYPLMSEADQDDVVDAVRRVLAAHRKA